MGVRGREHGHALRDVKIRAMRSTHAAAASLLCAVMLTAPMLAQSGPSSQAGADPALDQLLTRAFGRLPQAPIRRSACLARVAAQITPQRKR